MQRKMMVPYLVIVLIFFSFILFCGCGGGSGGGQSASYWSDNTVTTPQIYGISNLNSAGQPIRVGDWCQINGISFGNSKGDGYVHFTLQDGTSGNADLIYSWSDSQIVCRVPQSKSKKRMHIYSRAAAAVSISIYTSNGTGSNSYAIEYDSSPNPTPQPTPPSPSPTPSVSPTPSPTSSVSPSPSPTSSISPSPSPTPSISPSPSPAATWWDMGSSTGEGQQCPNLCMSSTGVAYVSYDSYDESLDTWLVHFGYYDGSGYHQLTSIDAGSCGGFSSLALNENNVPYIAYGIDCNICVAKYENGAFKTVGTIIDAEAPSLYVSGTYAYLAYQYVDEDEEYVTAGFFDNEGVWQGFIRGGFNGFYPKLTGFGNTVYMAFMDCDTLVAGCFQGENWTILGDFATPICTLGITLDSSKNFYVAYLKEIAAKNKMGKEEYLSTVCVNVYKNGSWTYYPEINSQGVILYPYFSGAPAVKNGTVYLAYSELGFPDDIMCSYQVKQYSGSSWQSTGNPSFAPSENPNCFIASALDNNGVPYIFCTGPDSNLHLYKYAVSKGREH